MGNGKTEKRVLTQAEVLVEYIEALGNELRRMEILHAIEAEKADLAESA